MKKLILALLSMTILLYACSSRDARIPVAIVTPITHPSLEQIEQGFVETIEERFPGKYRFVTFNAQGNKTLMRSEIEEIAQGEFSLVMTIGTSSTQMTVEVFRKKGIKKPVVFTAVDDPVGMGTVDSEENPGGTITGVKQEVRFHDEIEAFLEYMPHLKRVLLVYNPVEAGMQRDAQDVAERLNQKNIHLKKVEVFKTNEIKTKVAAQLDDIQAILVLKDNTVVAGLDVLSKLCFEQKIALLASDLDSPDKGAAMGYGVYEREFGVEAAKKALLILEESRLPGSIPVTPVTDFSLKINREVAEKQGIVFKEEVRL